MQGTVYLRRRRGCVRVQELELGNTVYSSVQDALAIKDLRERASFRREEIPKNPVKLLGLIEPREMAGTVNEPQG